MAKRSQQSEADGSKHWYQDKYQHVLVQRNMLALLSLVALVVALVAVFAVARLAPLKSVEPYLLQIDERTGITQAVTPALAGNYMASEAVDKYFIAAYLRAREGYNPAIRNANDNIVRLMSSQGVFYQYRRTINPADKNSVTARLGAQGQRDINIISAQYISAPSAAAIKAGTRQPRIMQVRLITTERMPNAADVSTRWVATITFDYTDLKITEAEKLLNPLGFQVMNYQITRELA